MRPYLSTLSTLIICLAASTAAAQLLPARDENQPPPADKAAAGGRPAGPANPADAQAGPGAVRGPMMTNPMFAAIDVDGDGIITRNELRKAIAQLRKLDTDNDGNITLAEVSPQGGPMGLAGPGQFGDPNQMIDRLMQNDRNADGKLTADELPGQMAQQMIRNGDKDGDGALNRQEVSQAMQEMRNRFANMQGGFQGGPGAFPGAFPGGAGGAVGADQRQMMGQMLQWDRNGDGKLSPDEVPRQARGMLQNADQNGDGLIDAMEMRLILERNGERMRGAFGRGRNGAQEPGNADGNRRDR